MSHRTQREQTQDRECYPSPQPGLHPFRGPACTHISTGASSLLTSGQLRKRLVRTSSKLPPVQTLSVRKQLRRYFQMPCWCALTAWDRAALSISPRSFLGIQNGFQKVWTDLGKGNRNSLAGAKVLANVQMLITVAHPPQHWTWSRLEKGGHVRSLAFTAFVWQEAQEQAAQSPGSATQLNAPGPGTSPGLARAMTFCPPRGV